jgi:hypothetical protein
VWYTPEPLAGTPERLTAWVEALTRMTLGANDAWRVLNDAAWEDRRDRLNELGGPPE